MQMLTIFRDKQKSRVICPVTKEEEEENQKLSNFCSSFFESDSEKSSTCRNLWIMKFLNLWIFKVLFEIVSKK